MMLPNRCSFSAHQRMHRNRPPHVCPECGGNFLQANFQTHLREACLHFSRRVGYRSPHLSSHVSPYSPMCWLVSCFLAPAPLLASREPRRSCSAAARDRSVCAPCSGERVPWSCSSASAGLLGHRVSAAPPVSTSLGSALGPGRRVRWGAWRCPGSSQRLPVLLQVPQLCGGVWGCELHQVPHPDVSLRGFPQVPHLPHGLQICTQRPRPPLHAAPQLPHAAGQVSWEGTGRCGRRGARPTGRLHCPLHLQDDLQVCHV